MQLLTGTTTPTETKIVVVDVDGPNAWKQWKNLCRQHKVSYANTTWIAKSNRGSHLYYVLPEGIEDCPSGIIFGIWDTIKNKGKGGWRGNCEIRLLADRSLVMSPPSYHVPSGREYKFWDYLGPKYYKLPSVAPDWLLAMPRLKPPVFHQETPRTLYQPKQKELPDHQYSRADVLDAVKDKTNVVSDWGVVFPDWSIQNGRRRSQAEWVSCFVPGREDPSKSTPSGSFHQESGSLHDFATGHTMSFFDIGVATGQFATWQDCCNHLGETYIGAKK